MNTYGILMLCYLMLDGQLTPVKGRQTADRGAQTVLFYPDADHLPAREVELNNCSYLEEPEAAAKRMLAEAAVMQAESEANQKELRAAVDKIITGNKPWCRFDGWGRGTCLYDSMEHCLGAIKLLKNRREFTCNRNRYTAK